MRAGSALRLGLVATTLAFLLVPERFAGALAPLNANGAPAVYDQGSLLELSLAHLGLVLAASLGSAVLAVALAVLVTRPVGMRFLPLSRAVVNIGQTFPPVAVLALAVPLFGFGQLPALVALLAYGLLPVFENAVAGLEGCPEALREAADGMGMSPRERLVALELPLAAPMILEGLRLTLVISVGTATLGSTVAAQGLGEVIIAGLLSNNTAFVLQGGLLTAIMAIGLHDAMRALERRLLRHAAAV